jgi:tRNA pseudouridine38-40 synthase
VTARIDIAYDGRRFHGWARQPELRTVQGVLEAALTRLHSGRPIELTVAGRTDTGVHAWGQVASYEGEPVALRAVNALLPPDVAVRASAPAPDGFDARRDARSRTYCFRVLNSPVKDPFQHGRVLWWPRRIDRSLLHACAALLPGRHDFTAFTPTETEHVHFAREVLRAEWVEHGDLLELWIEADAFMRHMNRVLVGTMLQVAGGHRSVEAFAALLEGAHRRDAGPTAEPHGLYFAAVSYG